MTDDLTPEFREGKIKPMGPGLSHTGMRLIPAQQPPGHTDDCSENPKALRHFGWGAFCFECRRRIS